MKVDGAQLRRLRENRGLTQQQLARQSRTGLRTVQRAEAGEDIRAESAGFIVEELGARLADLRIDDLNGRAGPQDDVVVLRRCTSGRLILDTLEKSYMVRLECSVDPDGSNIALLKKIVTLLEARLPDPLSYENSNWISSLAEKLDATAALNDAIRELETHDIGIFVGSYSEHLIKPVVSPYDPPRTPDGALPSMAQLARIKIAPLTGDRCAVEKDVAWPVPIYIDWDDEVPF